MTKPKSPSTREILAVLRLEAERCEADIAWVNEHDVVGVNYTALLIMKHQAACFRAALKRLSTSKFYQK